MLSARLLYVGTGSSATKKKEGDFPRHPAAVVPTGGLSENGLSVSPCLPWAWRCKELCCLLLCGSQLLSEVSPARISAQFCSKSAGRPRAFLSPRDLRRGAAVLHPQPPTRDERMEIFALSLPLVSVPHPHAGQTLLYSFPYDYFFRGLSVLPKNAVRKGPSSKIKDFLQ